MTESLSIVFAQLNPTVGDIQGNFQQIKTAYEQAVSDNADLIIFPECFLCGYPAEDLLHKSIFLRHIIQTLEVVKGLTLGQKTGLIVGTPYGDGSNQKPYNGAVLYENGSEVGAVFKVHLPDYGVFDEQRVFTRGNLSQVKPLSFKGFQLGLMICEDMWKSDVADSLKQKGADILISLNASPFDITKQERRFNQVQARVQETKLPFIAHFQTGGQDELVFDGGGFGVSDTGQKVFQFPYWTEGLYIVDLTKQGVLNKGKICSLNVKKGIDISADSSLCSENSLPSFEDNIFQAMVTGLRDYVKKTGFSKVLLGLSGGIDSALTAVVAKEALGAENVHCVFLPFRYTSSDSWQDAEVLAKNLGVRYDILPIEDVVSSALSRLQPLFEGKSPDLTEENLQARSRGLLLMGLSNKFGSLLLTTGNKSEMAVGYCTLYGDMCGAYNVLKDLYKTDVYKLSWWFNQQAGREIIPERIMTRPPSAELRPDQTDQDSLPDYDTLDAILKHLVEEEGDIQTLVHQGFDETVVKKIQNLLYISEYKRRQSALGVKLTPRQFGKERRYPVVNRFRDNNL